MLETDKPTLGRLEQRLAAIGTPHGCVRLEGEGMTAFLAQGGTNLLFFAEDPGKVPETWDLAVILVEALKAQSAPVRIGLLPPPLSREWAPRYGVRVWPALVALRDGGYLGTLEGLQDWGIFSRRLPELLNAPVNRPPGVGIPVVTQT